MKKEKILLLGGCGFLGKHFFQFVNKYYCNNYEIVIIDKITGRGGCKYYNIDIFEASKLKEILIEEAPDYLVNLAGIIQVEDFDSGFRLNVLLSQIILDEIKKQKLKIKKILLIGSASEYGSNNVFPLSENDTLMPINLYGLLKMYQTECALFYHRTFGLPIVIARTFNIIGENAPMSSAIGSFLDKIIKTENNGTINVGNIDTQRDYLYIEDVVEAYMRILLDGNAGEIYNVCSSNAISMREILNEMIRLSNKHLNTVSLSNHASSEIMISCGDNTKLRQLGWTMRTDIITAIRYIMDTIKIG